MKSKHLEAYLSGGIEKHIDGSFTIYGYIDNLESGEEIGRHRCRYMDYSIKEAREMFKIELKDILDLCEEYKIFTNDEWITFDYPHKATF